MLPELSDYHDVAAIEFMCTFRFYKINIKWLSLRQAKHCFL